MATGHNNEKNKKSSEGESAYDTLVRTLRRKLEEYLKVVSLLDPTA